MLILPVDFETLLARSPGPLLPQATTVREVECRQLFVDRLKLRRPSEEAQVPVCGPCPPGENREEPPRKKETPPTAPPAPPTGEQTVPPLPDAPLPTTAEKSGAWLACMEALRSAKAPCRLSVQLSPPALGLLRVTLEDREGRLYARILAPSRVTVGLLRAHRQALLDLLGPEADLDIDCGSDFLDSDPDDGQPSSGQERR